MLAEAGHSVADSANQGLLLLGRRQSKREATEAHQFGFGMARYFWAFVVALILFSLGSLFAVYEGIQKLRHPHELERPIVAVLILALAVVLEGLSFRTAVRESTPLKGDQSWWRFIRTAKVPELPVVLLEDAGALIGLVIALTGVGLSLATDDAVFDAYGTLAIGVLLGVIAIVLSVETRSLLLGESASREDRTRLQDAIAGAPPVRRLIHMRTMHLGPEELLVAAKVEFDEGLSFAQVSDAIDTTEARIRTAVPSARVVYIEPAVFDPTRA
jgi:cation diffusion facilitator family transporter